VTTPTDPEEVQQLLWMAGWALLRIRVRGHSLGVRVMDYGAVEEFETGYGYTPAEARRLPPSAREIHLMDEACQWLGMIPDSKVDQRRVVAIRMLFNDDRGRPVVSYRRVAERLRTSAVIAGRWNGEGLRIIALALNRNPRRLEKIWLFRKGMEG
jgi:hypothetical protein